MLEGQIRRLMKRMEELENERRREEDWRMARVRWLSEMDKRTWLSGDGRNDRERRKGRQRKKRREWGVRVRRVKIANMNCWRRGSASWWIELKDQQENRENWSRRGETRDLLEVRHGDGMAGNFTFFPRTGSLLRFAPLGCVCR